LPIFFISVDLRFVGLDRFVGFLELLLRLGGQRRLRGGLIGGRFQLLLHVADLGLQRIALADHHHQLAAQLVALGGRFGEGARQLVDLGLEGAGLLHAQGQDVRHLRDLPVELGKRLVTAAQRLAQEQLADDEDHQHEHDHHQQRRQHVDVAGPCFDLTMAASQSHRGSLTAALLFHAGGDGDGAGQQLDLAAQLLHRVVAAGGDIVGHAR
jgi:hypothetical protein